MTLTNAIGRPRKYSFADMLPGDRQFFPLIYGNIRDLQNRLKTSAQKHGNFKTQRVMSNGALGVRVTKETEC
jgi:hypothetical protein